MSSYGSMTYGFASEGLSVLPPILSEFEILFSKLGGGGDQFRASADALDAAHANDAGRWATLVAKLPPADAGAAASGLYFLFQKYVSGCGASRIAQQVPQCLGMPFIELCRIHGTPPVCTHDAVNLRNWRLRDRSLGLSVDNIEVLRTVTGSEQEEWFYRVHIMIEAIGGPFVEKVRQLIMGEYNGDRPADVISEILVAAQALVGAIRDLLKHMHAHVDPKWFFGEIRLHLSGSSKLDLFPEGLRIRGTDIVLRYDGGSAAQSPLIQLLDIVLGIEHDSDANAFMAKSRSYMCQRDRCFLEDASNKSRANVVARIDLHVESREERHNLLEMVRETAELLVGFRRCHFAIATEYILKQIRIVDPSFNVHGDAGTAGTDFRKLLPNMIEATSRCPFHAAKKDRSVFAGIRTVLIVAALTLLCWWLWRNVHLN